MSVMLFDSAASELRIPTPCIGVCSTTQGDSVCRGCKRTMNEVIEWNSYSPKQKVGIEQRITLNLIASFNRYLVIKDTERLKHALVQANNLPTHRPIECQAFHFLRNYSVERPELIGIQPTKLGQTMTLKDCIQHINDEWHVIEVEQQNLEAAI